MTVGALHETLGTVDKARVLAEALPWIRAHRGRVVVVKIGGEALVDRAKARLVAGDLALMSMVGIRLVVVHGGGPQLTEAMSLAGVEPTFVGGLRVTDDDAMEVVRRVLVGSINSDLVACLAGAGLRAVGLSGSDGAIFSAHRTSGPGGEDLGRVGVVTDVDASLIGSLLDDGYVPVIAPVAPDEDGHALNVNADTVAGAVAGALPAAKLVFMTNVEGLFRDLGDAGSLVSEMTAVDLSALIGTLSAGMRPKAAAALSALAAGAGKVHILDGRVDHALLLEVFTDTGIGTQVLP